VLAVYHVCIQIGDKRGTSHARVANGVHSARKRPLALLVDVGDSTNKGALISRFQGDERAAIVEPQIAVRTDGHLPTRFPILVQKTERLNWIDGCPLAQIKKHRVVTLVLKDEIFAIEDQIARTRLDTSMSPLRISNQTLVAWARRKFKCFQRPTIPASQFLQWLLCSAGSCPFTGTSV